jgi:sigma-E factor negative regulatory protein RseB
MKRGARAVRPGAGALLGALLLTPVALADGITERATTLLEQMATALRSLTYEGTLVYLHENHLEALHLVHHVEDGQVQERLVALNGPVRAVTRERDEVMCVLPDRHPISVKRAAGAGSLLNTQGIVPSTLLDHYRIEIQGVARVAGREAEVLEIIPRDGLRYGYRFFIDRETFLPLKSDLIDGDQAALEQLMFTAIRVTPADVLPAPEDPPALRNAPPTEGSGDWRFESRPRGFQLVSHRMLEQPGGAEVQHFLFTDRLSSYSIYIEPDTRDGLGGSTHMGTVHAAGRQADGFQITAVGEVPAATVEAAVAGVRFDPRPTPLSGR